MLKLLRVSLILILTISVPLQGFAAVSAALCDAQDDHHGAAVHADDHEHGSAAPHSHGKPGDKVPQHDCPPCSASAAITTFRPLAVLQKTRLSTPSSPVLPFSGVTPERLDRPPLVL